MPRTPMSAAADPAALAGLAGLAGSIRPDDAGQEVLLAALERPPAPRTSLTAWFHGAVHLQGLQHLRAEGSRRSRERRVARPESTRDVRHELDQEERRQVLARGLDSLDTRSRAILRAHYWDGLSLTAIADRDGCSLGSVKRRHAAALEQLRMLLGDPAIDRSDWGLVPLVLAGAASLALALGLGLADGPTDPVAGTLPATTAAMVLQPSTKVAALDAVPMIDVTPAFEAPSSSSLEASLTPSTVPMMQLAPATAIEEPELPEPEPVVFPGETTIAAISPRHGALLGS